MDIQKTMKNLEANGIKPYFVESREEVLPLVKTLINKGESISNGGSETLKQCGIFELIKNGDYDFIDRTGLEGEEVRQAYIRAFGCDTYFCSSNAVTENGELYNVDGNSNRVACIVYGPRQVIMVVGKNKIVKDINEAIYRVKCCAAPPNTVRLNLATPCAKTGRCVSLMTGDSPLMSEGCKGSTRICCNYVVSAKQRHKDRIKVIIVNEDLGY
ncbi:MAG: lactate utilization protein [Eubacterium sp.]|nr:lactate utilization protein [Eubacterium sp.]